MIMVTFDVYRATCISDIPSSRILRGVCMGLEGMSEIHASRSRRFNCLLPAFIRCRLLISQDGGYFCGDVSFFVIVFDINGENISCAKKFLEA